MSSFSFGISREAYSKVYIKENLPIGKNVPGPGTYNLEPKVGNEANKYSLRGRNSNHSKGKIALTIIVMLTSTRFNPGPGTYEPKT